MFVNNDLLKAAGQKTPAELIAAGDGPGTTRRRAAPRCTRRPARPGLVVRDFDYKAWDNLASVWNGWGAAPWSADGKTCTLRPAARWSMR